MIPHAAKEHCDAIVVGAGIVGLANALALARRGLRVTVLERHSRAVGASIRNFGMVWPIGQPAGALHDQARRSRDLWAELAAEAAFSFEACGSLHLAHREDEAAVLEEFAGQAKTSGVEAVMLTSAETLARSPAPLPNGLLGALWSPTEACVCPPDVVATLPGFLHRKYGVRFVFDCPVSRVAEDGVWTADGNRWQASRTVVCSGEDFRLLLPEAFVDSGIRRCKLQMLKTTPQPGGWSLGPMIASGLTLRHYAIFQDCRSLVALKERVARETPELDRFGVHVMASQHPDGGLVLGDSHEYDDAITPFDRAEIDALMLRELRKIVRLPSWEIAARWHGIYAKHPSRTEWIAEPAAGLTVMNALGGAGMTRSFALAEDHWAKRLG
jgi:D-hydroxyproline dehydrogenase subunit beta